MDANVFFREVTLRICGSLEIEVALWRTFRFLEKHIPAEKAFLHYYDPEKGVSTVIASASAAGGKGRDFKAAWPEEWHLAAVENRLPESLIVNDAETHPLARIILGPLMAPQLTLIKGLLLRGEPL